MKEIKLENMNSNGCDVGFQLYQELYGSHVQMSDRFESVHIWDEALSLKNKGRWIPKLITKIQYEAEKFHPWNNLI